MALLYRRLAMICLGSLGVAACGGGGVDSMPAPAPGPKPFAAVAPLNDLASAANHAPDRQRNPATD